MWYVSSDIFLATHLLKNLLQLLPSIMYCRLQSVHSHNSNQWWSAKSIQKFVKSLRIVIQIMFLSWQNRSVPCVSRNVLCVAWHATKSWSNYLTVFESLWKIKWSREAWGGRDGAEVRALAPHHCDPSSIPWPGVTCGLSLLLVLVPASTRDKSSALDSNFRTNILITEAV